MPGNDVVGNSLLATFTSGSCGIEGDPFGEAFAGAVGGDIAPIPDVLDVVAIGLGSREWALSRILGYTLKGVGGATATAVTA